MIPDHRRVFRPGIRAGVIRTWRDPARDLEQGRRRGVKDPAEAHASPLHAGTAHPLTCDEAEAPARQTGTHQAESSQFRSPRWVSPACLIQPECVEADRALRADQLGPLPCGAPWTATDQRRFPARSLSVHYIVGISVLRVLHRVTVPYPHPPLGQTLPRARTVHTPGPQISGLIPIRRLVVHIALLKQAGLGCALVHTGAHTRLLHR